VARNEALRPEAHRGKDQVALVGVLEEVMNDHEKLAEAKRRYPYHNFHIGPETGLIGFEHEDMWITDPFSSECGRFPMMPTYYGIDMKTALWMKGHNLPIQDAMDTEAERQWLQGAQNA
jgi:hypothetical protein